MRIELQSPLDMHLHLREDTMMQNVAPLSATSFAGGVIMPNLVSPVDSVSKVSEYREAIIESTSGLDFKPFMTLFFKEYSRDELIKAKDKSGGSGAKFVVRWKSKVLSNAPLIEAIMISTQSGQGISFVSRGRAIHE